MTVTFKRLDVCGYSYYHAYLQITQSHKIKILFYLHNIIRKVKFKLWVLKKIYFRALAYFLFFIHASYGFVSSLHWHLLFVWCEFVFFFLFDSSSSLFSTGWHVLCLRVHSSTGLPHCMCHLHSLPCLSQNPSKQSWTLQSQLYCPLMPRRTSCETWWSSWMKLQCVTCICLATIFPMIRYLVFFFSSKPHNAPLWEIWMGIRNRKESFRPITLVIFLNPLYTRLTSAS